ncbi:HAMP domain-containing sensor histidine kinase [Clostridium sp. C8-1-8]|uniref:sensor histidine kinase n=1 Tax=Clostridium sp. C8-1-8 TaxID=2698831 RepID=UPI00136CDB16|nr:HAMP domain-containing sensor histidine kinase [Clostridium sp. C8-1-8]
MDIKSKSKSKFLKVIASWVAVFSLVTILFVGYDVFEHSEYIEEDGFYKTSDFMVRLRNISEDLVDYVQKYKNEDYVKTVPDDEVKVKQNDLKDQLEKEVNNINNNFSYKISDAQNRQDKDEESKLNKEKNEQIKQVTEKYEKQINDVVTIKNEIIDVKLESLKMLDNKLNSYKNLKYYIINNKDKTVKSNISNSTSYSIDDFKKAISKNMGFYIRNYSQDYDVLPTTYDCNIKFSDSSNSKDMLDDLAGFLAGNTVYLSVNKYITEGDALYLQYIKYLDLKATMYGETLVALIAAVLLAVSLFMLIRERRTDEIKNLNLLDRIPIEIKLAFIITSFCITFFIMTDSRLFYVFSSRDYSYIALAIILTSTSLFILIKDIDRMRDNSIRSVIFNSSILHKIHLFFKRIARTIKEMLYIKSVFFKLMCFVIITLVIILSATIFIILLFSPDEMILGLILLAFVILFSLFTIAYSFRNVAMINKIIIGAERICSGDLNYSIEAKGKGNLARLANNINNMKAGLKNSIENEVKSDRLKTELITNVSHDLKTPLTSIINYVDLLKKDDISPEEMRDYIKVLDRKSQRLKVLIEDLFEASKAASGALELNIEKVEVSSLLKQTLAEFEEKIKEAELDFRVSYPEEKLYIMADGKKLWRVFENLITNILKYSLNRTRVYILMVNEDGKIKISMKNISAYELEIDSEELVERFKRGDKSRNTEGSGLGLAIAKSLVELQKGVFNIEIDGDLFKVIMEFTEVK